MKTVNIFWFALILFTIAGCEKNEFNSNNPMLTGSWIIPLVNDSLVTYQKSNELKENEYGIQFKPDGKFIERKNSGWCATPPISYADFDGHWEEQNTIIRIKVDYWGGKAEYKWEIIAVDNNSLTIYRISEDYNQQDN